MKSEAYAAHDEPAKTQSISEQLEAPISLNPEQLEAAVGGLTLSPGRGFIWGLIWREKINANSMINPGNVVTPANIPGAPSF